MSEVKMFEIVSICKNAGRQYCKTNPKHPKADAEGRYPLHRVLMEIKLGRLLRDGEVVRHIDGNKMNADISNLELTTASKCATEFRRKLNVKRAV